MRWTWAVALLLLGGCDVIRFDNFVKQHATVTRTEPEPPGENCAHGGDKVLAGEDMNDDGQLSHDEEEREQYLCASAPPRVLLRTREEPAGTRCEHGGRAVETGIDTDRDGVLGDTEVTATEYVCTTGFSAVLVRTQPVAPGAACRLGGLITQAGNDLNGNGVLEAGEVSREEYGCKEPETVLSRVVLLERREDSECTSSRFYAMEAGPDLDLDGILDDDEVRATGHVCDPPGPLLTRHQEEPPGDNCLAGGVAVAFGGDEDRSQVLENIEIQSRRYVCQATATHDGTYEVFDAAGLAALRNISRIRGGLIISLPLTQQVVLPLLESVEGPLEIRDNPKLEQLALTGLRFVRGDLTVSNNPFLTSVSLGPATFPRSREVSVDGSLKVDRNARLTSLSGMTAVAPRQGLEITDNATLEGAGIFTFVQSLPGTVSISGNPMLTDLPLPQVYQIGSLHIADNPSLPSLVGLRRLRSVLANVSIVRNEMLEDVSALADLQSIGQAFEVWGNSRLANLALPLLIRVGSLNVENNANLVTVGPMRSLRDVGSFLHIVGNPRLHQVTELSALQSIRGELVLSNNRSLSNLSGFERLTIASSLSVNESPALLSLMGLRGLRELDSLLVQGNPALSELRLDALAQVRVGFRVSGNAWLPTCRVSKLAAAVHTGLLADRVIGDNDETTLCPP